MQAVCLFMLYALSFIQAVCLSFVEVFTLSREDLEDVLREFPDANSSIEHAAKRMQLQRYLLLYACEQV